MSATSAVRRGVTALSNTVVARRSYPRNPPVGCTDNMGAPELQSIATELGQRTGAQRAQLMTFDQAGCSSSGGIRPAFIGYSGTTRDDVAGRLRSVDTCLQAADGRFACEVQGLSVIVVLSSTANGNSGATVWLD